MSTDYDSPFQIQVSDLQTLAEQLVDGSEPSPLPLSSAQLRLWFLDQFEPNSPRYNIPTVVWLAGSLEKSRLKEALKTIVARHEMPRARFIDQEGEPAQVIDPEEKFELYQQDLRVLPLLTRDMTAQCLIEQEARRPFDLAEGPLLRTTLLQLSETEHVLIINMHHIISDEWSIKLFYRELREIYTALVTGTAPDLPELPIQYGDYAAWQQEWMQSEEFHEQLEFWKGYLSGNPSPVKLPTDRAPRAGAHASGALRIGHLPPEIQASLHRLATRQKVTPFMALLAGFKALLHRVTGQSDIIVGSPMACRHRPETENLIGLFANTLPLRTQISGDMTFEQLLARVRDGVIGAFCHQEMPFEKLVETLQPERVAGQTPFISVLFLYQNDIEFPELPGLQVTFLNLGTDSAKFDITVFVAEVDEGLVLGMEYSTVLFDRKTIAGFLNQFEQILCDVAANPHRRISEIPLSKSRSTESHALGWTPPATAAPRWQFLSRWFELRRERGCVPFEHGSTEGGALRDRLVRHARGLGGTDWE